MMLSPTDESPFEAYKKNIVARKSKLEKLLGEQVDVSVVEIEREGLKALLHSKIPLAYFMYSLLNSYSCELLCFYLDVDRYETCQFRSKEAQLTCARQIFTTYLDPRSFLEINVNDSTKKEILQRMRGTMKTCFEPAKQHILGLLETSFVQFRKDPIFQQLKKDTDHEALFSRECRQKAYELLQTRVPTIEPGSPSEQRNMYLANLISEFCRRILKIKANDN